MEIKRVVGYTRANLTNDDGEIHSYNAHPCYHDGPWYDWAYVYYENDEDSESESYHYPSKILGFIEDGEDINAVIQCSIHPVAWSTLEDDFITKFTLCTEVGKEEIVPISSLIHPICVVPDFGEQEDSNRFMMILPKGQWSEYFARFVNNDRRKL